MSRSWEKVRESGIRSKNSKYSRTSSQWPPWGQRKSDSYGEVGVEHDTCFFGGAAFLFLKPRSLLCVV